MSILSGFEKIKRYNKKSNGYKLLSHWTSSDTVEMSNGSTLTTAFATKANLVNGVVPLSELPKAALDNLVKVANDTARFALTTSEVQNGDTVYVIATELMYLVVDDTKLNQEAGYQGYSATANWSTLEDKPDNIVLYDDDDDDMPSVSPVLRQSNLVTNLTTSITGSPLDATMGKALKDDLGAPSSASAVTGSDAFTKINTLNQNLVELQTSKLDASNYVKAQNGSFPLLLHSGELWLIAVNRLSAPDAYVCLAHIYNGTVQVSNIYKSTTFSVDTNSQGTLTFKYTGSTTGVQGGAYRLM